MAPSVQKDQKNLYSRNDQSTLSNPAAAVTTKSNLSGLDQKEDNICHARIV
jgi:hypothetical protein